MVFHRSHLGSFYSITVPPHCLVSSENISDTFEISVGFEANINYVHVHMKK